MLAFAFPIEKSVMHHKMKILIKTDNTGPAAETGLPTKRQQ